MSRAFGDIELKTPLPLVIADPEVRTRDVLVKTQEWKKIHDGVVSPVLNSDMRTWKQSSTCVCLYNCI